MNQEDNPMDLKESHLLDSLTNNHWYYQSKARTLITFLGEIFPKKILDVGAGSGFFSRYLLLNTQVEESRCIDINYPEDREELLFDKKLFFQKEVSQHDAELVLLMDVLEHVDDDTQLLKHYVDRLPSGSQFFITVPAFQFLWSSHDEFLEHKRRYTLNQLEHVVRNAGLNVERGSYYFGLILPIVAALRLVEHVFPGRKYKPQLQKHKILTNGILIFICSIERVFMKVNRLAGLSVFCLAKKP
jgi:trans-aconitate methyltransferase